MLGSGRNSESAHRAPRQDSRSVIRGEVAGGVVEPVSRGRVAFGALADVRARRLEGDTRRAAHHVYVHASYDTSRVLYAFRKLKLIIECDFQLFMRQMASKSVNGDLARQLSALLQQHKANKDDNDDDDGGSGANDNGADDNADDTVVDDDQEALVRHDANVQVACRSYLHLMAHAALLFIQGEV